MKPFPVLQLRISIEKRWRENLSTWPPIINRSEKVSKKLVEEVLHMKKQQLATNLAKMPILPMIKIDEKVSSMYRQHYEEKPSQVQEECDPEVYGENVEKKLQSISNSIGDQSALFLMAVGDCIVNKKSQAEVATKYNIPRSRIQRAMSGKKEH